MNEYSKRKRKKKLSKSFWCGCLSWKMPFFLKNSPAFFMLPYSLLWLNEVVEPCWTSPSRVFCMILGSSSIFFGGHKLRVVNCGNRCFSPPPIFMKSRTWWWFLTTFLSWFWHRFSFLSQGGKTQGQQSSASRISGVSGASENRAKWGRISLKNKHFSLPSFVLIATSPSREKNAHFSFGNFLPTSWKAWQKL